MKRNKKIMISALSIMLLMAIAVTILSFSYANNQNPDGELTDNGMLVAADGMDGYTIIDNIIENSYAEATDTDADPIYRIVEIGSSSTPSTLKDYVESKGFEEFVINGHGTIGKNIKADSIEYRFYQASSITNESTEELAYISNADFIYVSNDSNSEYSVTNDLCEELYNILHTYAVGTINSKPLVIDSPKATTVSGDDAATETMSTLANDVFAPSGRYYYTFSWNQSISAADFLSHNEGSLYLGINGKNSQSNGKWTQIYDKADLQDPDVKTFNVSNFLVVSSTGSTRTMTDKLLEGCANVDLSATHFNASGEAVNDTNLYELAAGSKMKTNGYNSRYVSPDYVAVTEMSLADIEADIDNVNFDMYDMIIIEADCGGKTISTDLYKKFAAAMYGCINIVYDSTMATATGSSDSTDVPDDLKETNYLELYYMVATLDNVSRYENVMVTDKKQFDIITSSKSIDTAKVIADLINASSFRGIGGKGSSSSMFTVLEIQPCYPIDETLAQEVGKKIARNSTYSKIFGSGNYYTVPADVVNGKTKEEIADGTEYYAWELSKAKLADALGLSANQINLVQMSSEELATSKVEIAGTYDLIYIGGNTTALKGIEQYVGLVGLANWGGSMGMFPDDVTSNELKQLPFYTTYSHNGDMVKVDLSAMGDSPGPANGKHGGIATALVSINGSTKDSFALLNGNDITYDKYTALKKYVDLGMPVVISDDLSVVYNVAKQDGYLQNGIDPDSNMYKLLKACDGKDNVLWDFDKDAVVYRDNDGGSLGNTITGYVSVFASSNGTVDDSTNQVVTGQADKLLSLYNTSSRRPKLTITSMPATYNQYDTSTQITDGKLKFNYRIAGGSGSGYTVKLYIDDDGNSTFDRKEEYIVDGSSTSLTYQCADSFFGPLYWMIEVTDKNGMSVNTTGIAYVKNKTDSKQQVRVLQIMPSADISIGSHGTEGAEGYNSLYFCTVCQQTYQRLENNPISNAGDRDGYGALYGGNYFDTATGYTSNGRIYLGKHEHNFGIVSYDSSLEVPKKNNNNTVYGMDDWDDNLADQVSDLYDFDLDIMLRDEFEQAAYDVRQAYDFSEMSDAEKKEMIDNFKIDKNDTDYAVYSALTEQDDKLKFIKQREYEQLASQYWQWYQYMATQSALSGDTMADESGTAIAMTTVDARNAMDEIIREMISNADNPSNNGSRFSCTSEKLKSELQRLIDEGCYYDYYSINNSAAIYNDVSLPYLSDGKSFDTYYKAYVTAKDKELEYKELYKMYSRYAAGDSWLEECYDSLIIGPSEDFGGDDIGATDIGVYALADLEDYVANNGNVLLFHDTLTKFNGEGATNLTARLRAYFGMDRYHMTMASSASEDTYYVPYTTTQDSNKYFMTNLSTKTTSDKYSSWLTDMKSIFSATPSYYLSSVAYTDMVSISSNRNTNQYAMPYKYAELSWSIAGFWYNAASFSAKDNTKYGTDKASQNNVGIVTMFPFTLSSELNISGTHSQAYAVDLENDKMTVWYSLAGGTNTKEGSSMYAASPRDGMDNYFIYTYGNVNYCGAGHSKVTGVGKDNNDERMLYINIICNSVRQSVKQPAIYVYDYEKDTVGDKIKLSSSNEYYTTVDEPDEYPEFSFKVVVDAAASLQNVRIYYDLDYSATNQDNAYVADDKHKLIADWNSSHVKAGVIKDVFRYDASLKPLIINNAQVQETYVDADGNEKSTVATMLKLQPSYFEPYNNEYTYIVIEATDNQGNTVYQRIKVKLKDVLFNLT